jgi:hypothetical protein
MIFYEPVTEFIKGRFFWHTRCRHACICHRASIWPRGAFYALASKTYCPALKRDLGAFYTPSSTPLRR